MYEAYYGLSANPFRLAPDPQFFYESACHKRGLAYLRYGLHQGQGFVVVTGVPGTGKSLLVQTIFAELAGQRMVVSSINNTNLQADDTLRAVANSFDIYCNDTTKAALLNAVERFLIEKNRQGKRVLLIVDEAQNLPLSSLEELRMLSNFQNGDQPLMQIMLLGQQQLQQILADPRMEQFTQRVIASCHLRPLDAADTRGYIAHRLSHVGWCGKPNFTGEALGLIHHCSQGIPRLINTFCDRLLLAAYLDEKMEIDANHVRSVVKELQGEATGAWQSINIDAAPPTSLAPLPDGEICPPAMVPMKPLVAPAPSVQTAEKAVTKPAQKEVPAVAPEESKQKSVASAVAPTVTPAKEAPKKVVPKRPLVTREPVTEFIAPQHPSSEPLSEEITKSADSSLPPLMQELDEDQPPPLEYRDPEAIAARRWWIGIGVVAIVLIAVLLVMLFVGTNKNLGYNSASTPPANQNQGAIAPSKLSGAADSKPASEATSAVAENRGVEDAVLPLEDGGVAEPAAATSQAKPVSAVQPVTNSVMNQQANISTPLVGSPPPAVKAPLSLVSPQVEKATMAQVGAVSDAPPELIHAPGVASEPRRQQLESGATAVAATKPSISDVELPDFINTFVFAYESGDIDRFTALFSKDAQVDNRIGRQKISRDYLELFRATDMRSMKIGDIKWKSSGATAQGSSDFEVTVWRHGSDTPSVIKGELNIEVAKVADQLMIQKLNYLIDR